MSQAHFSLTYDGEAVRDGELDVTDLASALLALAQAVKATGKIVIGPDADVTLRVRTLRAKGAASGPLPLSQRSRRHPRLSVAVRKGPQASSSFPTGKVWRR